MIQWWLTVLVHDFSIGSRTYHHKAVTSCSGAARAFCPAVETYRTSREMGYLATIRKQHEKEQGKERHRCDPCSGPLLRFCGDIRSYQMHSFRRRFVFPYWKGRVLSQLSLVCWRVKRTQLWGQRDHQVVFGKETIPELVDLHTMHIQSFRELLLGNKTSPSMDVCESGSDTNCFFWWFRRLSDPSKPADYAEAVGAFVVHNYSSFPAASSSGF